MAGHQMPSDPSALRSDCPVSCSCREAGDTICVKYPTSLSVRPDQWSALAPRDAVNTTSWKDLLGREGLHHYSREVMEVSLRERKCLLLKKATFQRETFSRSLSLSVGPEGEQPGTQSQCEDGLGSRLRTQPPPPSIAPCQTEDDPQ